MTEQLCELRLKVCKSTWMMMMMMIVWVRFSFRFILFKTFSLYKRHLLCKCRTQLEWELWLFLLCFIICLHNERKIRICLYRKNVCECKYLCLYYALFLLFIWLLNKIELQETKNYSLYLFLLNFHNQHLYFEVYLKV